MIRYMGMKRKWLAIVILLGSVALSIKAQEDFRVWPYLQNPSMDSITILWFSGSDLPGQVEWYRPGDQGLKSVISDPLPSESLAYSRWEDSTFFGGEAPSFPFRHRVRIGDLEAGATYSYEVTQGSASFHSTFRTAPQGNQAIRFIVYSDSETEPESTGNFTSWPDPDSVYSRKYLIDQTTGYRNNLQVIRSRQPDLVLIAGDLTQHGGEQRDWDAFWIHNTDSVTSKSLAGQVPMLTAPGNHEYYEGNYLDGYSQPGSERAISRYLTYFEAPSNHALQKERLGRYYSYRYGPVTVIALDLCNNGLNGSEDDTNFYLLGESDPEGGMAPDFGHGSRQYTWLESQLIESQKNSLFTFVMFHHIPYSSGPHSFPAGEGEYLDNQSGVPARLLTPLFLEYGVDAVFCGHDEIWERSEVTGTEKLPDGTEVAHSISFFDVGVGGDGLRGPMEGSDNSHQQFLVHEDVPEVWEEGILVSGGKHYGHLEVDILPLDDSTWNAVLTPAYVFPLYNKTDSTYSGIERRQYNDQVVLTRIVVDTTVSVGYESKMAAQVRCYPNPFSTQTTFEYPQGVVGEVRVSIFDAQGRLIRILHDKTSRTGSHTIKWNGKENSGIPVPSGLYLYRIEMTSGDPISGRVVFNPSSDY